MKSFPDSELILNADGSVFHLHLLPGQIAETILLVGDPGRVDMISALFSKIEFRIANREFITVTGEYKGKRISVVGTGIGTDNIDIVINELDVLVNVDLKTRTEKPVKTVLNLIRIGTCGGMQPDLIPGTFLISEKSIGFDGLLNFYAGRDEVCDLAFEKEFRSQVNWADSLGHPYVISASSELIDRIGQDDMKRGVTISANGFYGPQGRELRIPLAKPNLNALLQQFSWNGYRVTNYEMESSAVAGLAALLGHRAMTVCVVIANRMAKEVTPNYHQAMEVLIETVLERI
ncbi:MAG TPA: nucleoside phosphorylase [Bacteroidales bacterium]|nr:nucleoside phosphorylase [Bacteroidales bacterium]